MFPATAKICCSDLTQEDAVLLSCYAIGCMNLLKSNGFFILKLHPETVLLIQCIIDKEAENFRLFKDFLHGMFFQWPIYSFPVKS